MLGTKFACGVLFGAAALAAAGGDPCVDLRQTNTQLKNEIRGLREELERARNPGPPTYREGLKAVATSCKSLRLMGLDYPDEAAKLIESFRDMLKTMRRDAAGDEEFACAAAALHFALQRPSPLIEGNQIVSDAVLIREVTAP